MSQYSHRSGSCIRENSPRTPTKGKQIQMKEIFPRRREDTVWTGMHQLYDQYIQRKGFRDLYNPFEHINERDSFLVFYIGDVNQLIGFTKIKRYHWHEHYYDDAWTGTGVGSLTQNLTASSR
jgi:hypothetical protein